MKRMPNLELSPIAMKMLFQNRFNEGAEAIICRSGRAGTLYKIFKTPEARGIYDAFGVPPTTEFFRMSENKERKVAMLYNLELEHSVWPIQTLSCDGRLIGYEMTYDSTTKTLASAHLPIGERIAVVRKCQSILEYYESYEIVYGDIATASNILIKPGGEVMLCDMDNIGIGDCPIDIKGRFLKRYEEERGIDSATNSYMLNVLTVGLLDNPYGDVYFETVRDLVNQAPREYLLPEAINILDSMNPPSKFTGEYIAPYIKLPQRR